MRMGLVGFPDERHLHNLLQTRSHTLRWKAWPFVEADALWVNGTHAQQVRDGMVRIPAGQPEHRATVLNLREIDRPIAFTLPLRQGASFTPPHTFDPHSADSVAAVMKIFENELQQPGLELAFAHQVAARRHDLRSPVFHLMLRGALAGVVNVTGEVGLAPGLSAADFDDLQWSGRPPSAGDVPSHFVTTTMQQAMWRYVGRTEQDMLPSRYRDATIYYRRMPRVAPKMLRDTHLLVISELSARAQTLTELRAATGLPDKDVAQAVAALYFGGSITTDGRKAAGGDADSRQSEGFESQPDQILQGQGMDAVPVPPRPGRRMYDGGASTVPTPLEIPRKRTL